MVETYKLIEYSSLKMDKNLIEIQKTIIYYGEKISEEIKHLKTLIDTNSIKELEKGKERIIHKEFKDPITKIMSELKIPEGYKK